MRKVSEKPRRHPPTLDFLPCLKAGEEVKVNHPNQKLDPDNNIPLIQIFHSATERNNWVKAYADNPHVKTIDSKQAIRWLRFTYRQYRNQKIPSRMSRDAC